MLRQCSYEWSKQSDLGNKLQHKGTVVYVCFFGTFLWTGLFLKGEFYFSKRCWGFMTFSVWNWERDIKIACVCVAKCRTEEQPLLVKADIPRQGMQEIQGQFLVLNLQRSHCRPLAVEPALQVCLVVVSSTRNSQERLEEDESWPCCVSSPELWLWWYLCVPLCQRGEVLGNVSQHTEICRCIPPRGMGTKTGQEKA